MISLEKYKKTPTVVRASIWYVVCNVMQKAVAFFTTPLFTRIMSTEQYGQVIIYSSWLEVFNIFATLNIFYGAYNNALVKYKENRNVATSSFLGLSSTISVVMYVGYLILHKWINKVTGMSTLMTTFLFAEILFTAAYKFWMTKERFEFRYRSVVIISICMSLLMPLLGIPAVLLAEQKAFAKIVSMVVAQLVISLYLYVLIFASGRKFYVKQHWKYALWFNIPLIPHYLSSTILNQCDHIMIKKMCGDDKAGIYGLAYTIGMLAILIITAINNSFTPWIYAKLKNEQYSDISSKSEGITLIVVIFTVCIVAVAPEIIWILGGEQYVEGAWIIAPIAASVFFRFLYNIYSNVEFYYEENKYIMVASIVCAIVNVTLNYILINAFGYLAAGYTTLVCFILYAGAHVFFVKRVVRKRIGIENVFNNKRLSFQAVAVLMMCAGLMMTYQYIFLRYTVILVCICFCIVFRNKLIKLMINVKTK